MVCSIVLQHSNWKKSKQGREQQRVLFRVRSNVRAQQCLLQKVEGDKGVLENLLSFCVNKSGRRGQKKSCSAAAATNTERNRGQNKTFSLPEGLKLNYTRVAVNTSQKPWRQVVVSDFVGTCVVRGLSDILITSGLVRSRLF